jgi:hypothetical protein
MVSHNFVRHGKYNMCGHKVDSKSLTDYFVIQGEELLLIAIGKNGSLL